MHVKYSSITKIKEIRITKLITQKGNSKNLGSRDEHKVITNIRRERGRRRKDN